MIGWIRVVLKRSVVELVTDKTDVTLNSRFLGDVTQRCVISKKTAAKDTIRSTDNPGFKSFTINNETLYSSDVEECKLIMLTCGPGRLLG